MPHILGRGRVNLRPAPGKPGPAGFSLHGTQPGLKGRHYWQNGPRCQPERPESGDFEAFSGAQRSRVTR